VTRAATASSPVRAIPPRAHLSGSNGACHLTHAVIHRLKTALDRPLARGERAANRASVAIRVLHV
jgi:hypothetical protein